MPVARVQTGEIFVAEQVIYPPEADFAVHCNYKVRCVYRREVAS